ncbi:MAG: HepT-like ribonuclease domain-containing protein [Thermomicrobiales bacterium]
MMHPKSPKWLDDIADACAFIAQITANATAADYDADRLLRHAVERNFEIIGEALRRLERTDPLTAARISGYRAAGDFRNRLAHQYDDVDNAQVWEIVQDIVPVVYREAEQLLREAEMEASDEPSR